MTGGAALAGGSSPYSYVAGAAPRSVARKAWTTPELRRFKAAWAEGGLAAATLACPDRTPGALYQVAKREGLIAPKPPRPRRPRLEWNEHQDDLIRRKLAEPRLDRGVWDDLALTLRRPRQAIQQRAKKLGLRSPRFKPPPWSAAEDAILAESQGLSAKTMEKRLHRAGFPRSIRAVQCRLSELRLSGAAAHGEDAMNAAGLARMLGLAGCIVARWCAEGALKAKRRDGRSWLVTRPAFRKFVLEHPARIDLAKVEAAGSRYWFLDLIGGGA